MKLVCTSDLHGHWDNRDWPDGDVLIVAGDITVYGGLKEIEKFNDRLAEYPYRHKLICAGNHDWCFYDEDKRARARLAITNGQYLEDEYVVIDGIKAWLSPWTPQFYNWAFMKARGQMHTIWDKIPDDIDVLVTHGPAAGQCDWNGHEYTGCTELREAVERVKPKYHVCGHIHGARGTSFNEHTTFVNCARCNDAYNPVFEPIVVEI
jgi:Icc-related predicted phosphoesterase